MQAWSPFRHPVVCIIALQYIEQTYHIINHAAILGSCWAFIYDISTFLLHITATIIGFSFSSIMEEVADMLNECGMPCGFYWNAIWHFPLPLDLRKKPTEIFTTTSKHHHHASILIIIDTPPGWCHYRGRCFMLMFTKSAHFAISHEKCVAPIVYNINEPSRYRKRSWPINEPLCMIMLIVKRSGGHGVMPFRRRHARRQGTFRWASPRAARRYLVEFYLILTLPIIVLASPGEYSNYGRACTYRNGVWQLMYFNETAEKKLFEGLRAKCVTWYFGTVVEMQIYVLTGSSPEFDISIWGGDEREILTFSPQYAARNLYCVPIKCLTTAVAHFYNEMSYQSAWQLAASPHVSCYLSGKYRHRNLHVQSSSRSDQATAENDIHHDYFEWNNAII